MKILIPTDAFPPICGGSGWSTYELARGLRCPHEPRRGVHRVRARCDERQQKHGRGEPAGDDGRTAKCALHRTLGDHSATAGRNGLDAAKSRM